jgi:hypothetical protein
LRSGGGERPVQQPEHRVRSRELHDQSSAGPEVAAEIFEGDVERLDVLEHLPADHEVESPVKLGKVLDYVRGDRFRV